MRVSDIPLDASMGQSPLLYTLGVETQGEEGGLDLSLEPLSSMLSAALACFLLGDRWPGRSGVLSWPLLWSETS